MKETRNCEIRKTTPESRQVEGYALVFNKESRNLGGFTEIIEPEAVEGIVEKSDILCLLNHNEDRGVLARSEYGNGGGGAAFLFGPDYNYYYGSNSKGKQGVIFIRYNRYKIATDNVVTVNGHKIVKINW